MSQANSYAVVGDIRAKELKTRIALGVFLAGVAMLLTPGPFPIIWFAVMCAAQVLDRRAFQPLRDAPEQQPSPRRKAVCIASAALNTAIYSAISAYCWLTGGGAGQAFAFTAMAGGLLHVCLHMYHARPVLIAAALPHALYFLGLPVYSIVTHGLPWQHAIAIFAAGVLYLAHLAVAVRQSAAHTEALNKANDVALAAQRTAEAASAAKSDFLAVISHEIRTPMNAVISAGHLLRRTRLTREQAEPVDMLLNAGDVLMGLLNDVLDVSKIEAGKMVLDSADFDLEDRLMGLARLWGAKADEKGVEMRLDLSGDLPTRIRTDPLRFQQIVANLLSNAVKFTDRGHITLAGGVEGDQLWFEVRDTGVGVPAEMAERLFGHFEQADAGTTRRYGGTGLGLAISRRLAQMMGGELRLMSHDGPGATFRFETPWTPPATQAGADASVLATAGSRADGARRLLVAEDHEVNRRILSLMLEPAGYDLTFAENGQIALDLALQSPFDAILMDMQMPVMDGLQASGFIRSRPGPNQQAPIIALTANAMDHHRDAWKVVGVADFLTKPIQPETLFNALSSAVEASRSARAA